MNFFIVISDYASTSATDEIIVDKFYDALIQSLRTISNRYLLILGGYLNAQVESREKDRERAVGRFGWDDRCKRGRRLIEFAQQHNLVLANTLFQHKPS